MVRNIGTWVGAAALLSNAVSAITITENTVVNPSVDLSDDDLNINAGVVYSIVNNALTNIGGSVDNKGGFFSTSTGSTAASVSMTGPLFVNSGVVAFNGMQSTGGTTYNIVPTDAFSNTGSMYLGISSEPAPGISFRVTAGRSWSNSGTLVLQTASGFNAVASFGGSAPMDNSGTICLTSVTFSQGGNIQGKGCINMGSGSRMTISYMGLVFDQQLHLRDSSSVLSITQLPSNIPESSAPTYTVSGFGNSNQILVSVPFSTFAYDSASEILTLSVGSSFTLRLVIGSNYDSARFSVIPSITGNRGITYSGAPPNAVPDACRCDTTFPSPEIGPSVTPSSSSSQSSSSVSRSSSVTSSSASSSSSVASSSSSSISSSTMGPSSSVSGMQTTYTTTFTTTRVATESGVEYETTDAQGNWYTSTSLFRRVQTVTYTTTRMAVESGIVVVTSDAAGSLSTSVSLFAPGNLRAFGAGGAEPTLPAGYYIPPMLPFAFTAPVTTTFVSTNADGSVETHTGVVHVATNAAGSLVTTTSVLGQTGGYTTTYIATKADGSVETHTGVVFVHTDAAGSVVTSTSLLGHSDMSTRTSTRTHSTLVTVCESSGTHTPACVASLSTLGVEPLICTGVVGGMENCVVDVEYCASVSCWVSGTMYPNTMYPNTMYPSNDMHGSGNGGAGIGGVGTGGSGNGGMIGAGNGGNAGAAGAAGAAEIGAMKSTVKAAPGAHQGTNMQAVTDAAGATMAPGKGSYGASAKQTEYTTLTMMPSQVAAIANAEHNEASSMTATSLAVLLLSLVTFWL